MTFLDGPAQAFLQRMLMLRFMSDGEIGQLMADLQSWSGKDGSAGMRADKLEQKIIAVLDNTYRYPALLTYGELGTLIANYVDLHLLIEDVMAVVGGIAVSTGAFVLATQGITASGSIPNRVQSVLKKYRAKMDIFKKQALKAALPKGHRGPGQMKQLRAQGVAAACMANWMRTQWIQNEDIKAAQCLEELGKRGIRFDLSELGL